MQHEAFQYITEVFPQHELERRLTELGVAGWELITAKWEEYSYGGQTHNQARCILKRRIDPLDGDSVLDDDHDEFASTLKVFSTS